MKYVVGKMTGKQQKTMYKYSCAWTKLRPYLDPIAMPVITIIYVTKKEIPTKLIRFSLYLEMLNAWTCGFVIVSWKNSSMFIPPIDSMTFISMDCTGVFFAGAGVILGLGILQILFILLYFFTRTINKLVNIKARQMILKIQSFLEMKTFLLNQTNKQSLDIHNRAKTCYMLSISLICFTYTIIHIFIRQILIFQCKFQTFFISIVLYSFAKVLFWLETRVIIKCWPIRSTLWIWTDFHGNEPKKKDYEKIKLAD